MTRKLKVIANPGAGHHHRSVRVACWLLESTRKTEVGHREAYFFNSPDGLERSTEPASEWRYLYRSLSNLPTVAVTALDTNSEMRRTFRLDRQFSSKQDTKNYAKALSRFEARLHSAFDHEPIEDGETHEAEEDIREALQSAYRTEILEWLRSVVVERDDSHPLFSASILRCLSRESELAGTVDWRTALVRDALRLSDVQLRDAAVQAAENWGDLAMIEVLQEYSEDVQWLDAYRKDVIADLSA